MPITKELYQKQYECLYETGRAFEWPKWADELPYLDFHKDWLVRAVPPFTTGIIRYHIKHKKKPAAHVSIYFDAYDRAGSMDMKPYWEIFPHNGDCFRCYMHETDELIAAIKQSFKEQKCK